MADRHIYIDSAPGEVRGVLTLDGRPERLFIERGELTYPRLGERCRARVTLVDRGLGLAMLDLGAGREAALRLKADRAPPTQGQLLEVEVAIEPQGGKAAVVRVCGPAEGAPGSILGPMPLEARLQAFAPEAPVSTGLEARAAADEAEDACLAMEHALAGGAWMTVEPTRALTAVDVDLGQGGGRDGKRSARQANLNAIAALGRVLRLRAQGGLVVIDLVGRGHDGQALAHAAQAAFAPDQPGVAIGPVTRFGTLELALPRRRRPVCEILCEADGRLTARSLALRLVRAVEREARADPGGRLQVRCAPEVAVAAAEPAERLAGIVGRRFVIEPDPALGREAWRIGRS